MKAVNSNLAAYVHEVQFIEPKHKHKVSISEIDTCYDEKQLGKVNPERNMQLVSPFVHSIIFENISMVHCDSISSHLTSLP
jgi:hypothetical protein